MLSIERVAAGIELSLALVSFIEFRRLDPLRDPDATLAEDPLTDVVFEALRVVIWNASVS